MSGTPYTLAQTATLLTLNRLVFILEEPSPKCGNLTGPYPHRYLEKIGLVFIAVLFRELTLLKNQITISENKTVAGIYGQHLFLASNS